MKYWEVQSVRNFTYRRLFKTRKEAEACVQEFRERHGDAAASCLHITEVLKYGEPHKKPIARTI